MFCRNCGTEFVADQAVMCVKCGVKKGTGNSFCYNCGNSVQPNSTVCLNCGVALDGGVQGNKSKIAAGLLGIFLGSFGVHNFYLGYTSKAVIQLVLSIVGILTTCLIIGSVILLGTWIWGLVEGIMILTGKINTDAMGNLLAD
jgi:TM2 domain-containing membrane protein YozV